ncbi:MAG: hypothetical protein ICV69_10435 [Thermoleophilaceae bacterium]|nr:hypothetical protein [Thermoleophilaceae bacterium]
MASQRNIGGDSGALMEGGSTGHSVRAMTAGHEGSEAVPAQYEESPVGGAAGDPDVVLDVPQLKVDEIALEVDNLQARIALQVRLAQLLEIGVGADVEIDRVALEIKGVEAQAALTARLHNVRAILDRALATIDSNPDILKELAGTLGEAAGEVGGAAREAVGPGGAGGAAAKEVGKTGRQAVGGLSGVGSGAERKLPGAGRPGGRGRPPSNPGDARSRPKPQGSAG